MLVSGKYLRLPKTLLGLYGIVRSKILRNAKKDESWYFEFDAVKSAACFSGVFEFNAKIKKTILESFELPLKFYKFFIYI